MCLSYLDHAATSFPKPPCVIDAMRNFLAHDAGNPGRGGHRMAVAAEQTIDRLRQRLATLLNAESHTRIALTLNGTDALNHAIHAVIQPFAVGTRSLDNAARAGHTSSCLPTVVTTTLEHNSVLRPLRQYERDRVIALRIVPCDDNAVVNPKDVLDACDPTTVLVAMTHASNAFGTVQDVETVGRELGIHRPEALFLIDAAQTAGHIPVNAKTTHADFIAFPGHKALRGPTGTGALYISPRAYPDDGSAPLIGYRQGGTGGDSTNPVMPRSLPHQFEGGTPNTIGAAGLLAALEENIDHNAQRAHTESLAQRLTDALRKNPRITRHAVDAPNRLPVIAITIADLPPFEAAAILDDNFNIATRPGLHCAPAAHHALGTSPDGTLRLSLGPTNTNEDIDRTINALTQLTA